MGHEKKSKTDIRVRISVILKRQDGKLCFVRHFKDGKRYWLLPGGGQQGLEPVFEAANRELEEELCITCSDFNFLFLRESMSELHNRHIQFLVLEGVGFNLDNISLGTDHRVEGYDFFDATELASKTIYPAIKEDLISYLQKEPVSLFKSLNWI